MRRNLVADAPQLALGRFDFDHVRAEIGQNDRGSGTSDEARKIDNLQFRKNVVSCHEILLVTQNWMWPERLLGDYSLTLKLRLAFFEKGRRAFFLVFSTGAESEERGLKRETFSLARLKSFVHRFE